jgi:hypothetical protein
MLGAIRNEMANTATRQVRMSKRHTNLSAIPPESPTEMRFLTELCVGIVERLAISNEAARAVANRHRLVRSQGDGGVSIDFSEIQHRPLPARTPPADQPAIPPVSERLPLARPFLHMMETLKARITALEAELAFQEAIHSVVHGSTLVRATLVY